MRYQCNIDILIIHQLLRFPYSLLMGGYSVVIQPHHGTKKILYL